MNLIARKHLTSFGYIGLFTSIIFTLSISLMGLLKVKTANAIVLDLPRPTQLLQVSKHTTPLVLRGIQINPNNPLELDFIIDDGQIRLSNVQRKKQTKELINYFLAALTLPEEELWVNLSPYEKDRVAPEQLSHTSMGRDMLAQDYVLKQLSSSLTHPNTKLGKVYWDLVGSKNSENSRDVFSKVWISPDLANVYVDGNRAFIGEASLKVQSENDYFAMQKHGISYGVEKSNELNPLLEALDKEINNGQHFHRLRQIYHSLILATWFKNAVHDSIYNYYVNQQKMTGIEIDDKKIKDKLFKLYSESFEKGVYKLNHREGKQRKNYFSGGLAMSLSSAVKYDKLSELKTTKIDRVYKVLLEPTFSSGVTIKKTIRRLLIPAVVLSALTYNLLIKYNESKLSPHEYKAKQIEKLMRKNKNRFSDIYNRDSLKIKENIDLEFLAMMRYIQKHKSALDSLGGLIQEGELGLNGQYDTTQNWLHHEYLILSRYLADYDYYILFQRGSMRSGEYQPKLGFFHAKKELFISAAGDPLVNMKLKLFSKSRGFEEPLTGFVTGTFYRNVFYTVDGASKMQRENHKEMVLSKFYMETKYFKSLDQNIKKRINGIVRTIYDREFPGLTDKEIERAIELTTKEHEARHVYDMSRIKYDSEVLETSAYLSGLEEVIARDYIMLEMYWSILFERGHYADAAMSVIDSMYYYAQQDKLVDEIDLAHSENPAILYVLKLEQLAKLSDAQVAYYASKEHKRLLEVHKLDPIEQESQSSVRYNSSEDNSSSNLGGIDLGLGTVVDKVPNGVDLISFADIKLPTDIDDFVGFTFNFVSQRRISKIEDV